MFSSLMMGMRKERLILQLFAEGLITSILALLGGILVGGFLAIIITTLGFLLIQFIALAILGGRLFKQEVHQLLYEQMDKKQDMGDFKGNLLSILAGIILLGAAYWIDLYRFMELGGLLLL